MVDATPKQIGLSRLLLGARKLAPLLASSLALLLLMSPNPVLNGSGLQPEGRPPTVPQPSVQDDEPPPITEANPEGLEVPSEVVDPRPSITPISEERSIRYEYRYPPLKFAAARFGDAIYVGPHAIGTGCARFDVTVEGSEFHVQGMLYPIGAICPARALRLWKPIQIHSEETILIIRYRGERGTYRISMKDHRLDIKLDKGPDVAPPLSAEGWWRLPQNALISVISNPYNEAALKRTTDRIRLRLLASRSEPMDVPPGEPLDELRSLGTHYHQGFVDRKDFEQVQTETLFQMSFLSDLSDQDLQRIADEEARLENCTSVTFRRVRDYWFAEFRGTPPCDRPNG